jgi:hypothetical protein
VDSSRFNKQMKQFSMKKNESTTLVKACNDVHGSKQAMGCALDIFNLV